MSEFAQKVIDLEAPHFNEFKRTIDRKYVLYKIFRYVQSEYGFKVEKMRGSNQVLLYYNDVLIYDSDNEKTLADVPTFKTFLLEQIVKLTEKTKTFRCYFCDQIYEVVGAHGIATQDRKLIDVCDNCFEKPPTSRRIVRSSYELRSLSDWMLIK